MHPDKNPHDDQAEEKFREINEIYELLKDEKTRKIYDRRGEDGIKDMKDEQEGRKPNYHRRSYNDYQMEGLYDDDEEIITFDSSEFDFVDRGSDIWFVNFYSTWCSHCHDLAPTYRLLAKQFFGTINVGAVNCHEQRYLCQQQNIRGYPSLVLYVRGRRIDHQAHDRSLEGLIRWTFSQINPRIMTITNSNYLKAIISGKMSDSYIIAVCSSDADCIEETNNKKLATAFNKFADFYSLDCDAIDVDCEGFLDVDSGLYAARGDQITRIKSTDLMDIPSIVSLLKPKLLPEIEDPQEGEGIFTDIEPEKLKIVLATTGSEAKNQPIMLELRKIMSFLDNDSDRYRVVHFNCHDKSNKKVFSDCSRFINTHSNSAPRLTIIFVKNGQFNMYLSPSSDFRPAEIALATRDIKWTMPNWIQQLDYSNFDAQVFGNNQENEWWFIDFYSPSCPPCKSFMKVMYDYALDTRETTIEEGKKIPKIRLASVDCSLANNNFICNRFNVRSWPSGRLIKTDGAKTFNFDEDHTVEGIRTFFQDSFDPPLIKFTQDSFTDLVQKRPQGIAYLIKFGTTWCQPCRQSEQQMKILSRNLRSNGVENLKIGYVDCDEFKSFCSNRHFVDSYPTIKVFPAKWTDGASFDSPEFKGYQRNYLTLGNFLADEAGGDHQNFPIQYAYNDLQPILSNPKLNHLYLIDFYANWCQPCLDFKPKFTSLAIAWERSKFAQFFKENANNFQVLFIAFDCAGSQRNQIICQKQKVPHYPYIEYRFKHTNLGSQRRPFDRDSFPTVKKMIEDVRYYAQSASNVQYDYNYRPEGSSIKDEL